LTDISDAADGVRSAVQALERAVAENAEDADNLPSMLCCTGSL